jgi:uncharacterized protein involved in exopolysaccharide biosynthesis
MDEMKRELHDDEINLLDLVKVLLRHKGFIVKFVLVVMVGTAIAALLMTKIYESKAVISPVEAPAAQSGLATMAAQFGIASPQSSNYSEIVGLLKSDILMQKVMEKGKFRDILFDKGDLEDLSENEKVWEGIRLLKEDILAVKENKKDNTIDISARYKDPAIAQSIAVTTLSELTDHMTAEAKRVAETNMRHLETQIVNAADPFVRQKIYSLIAQQIETAMMAEAKENFAFKVLDPPRVPDKKVKPKRILMVAIAFVVSLFLGILLAFMREHYRRNREEWGEIGKMSGLRRFSWKRSHA